MGIRQRKGKRPQDTSEKAEDVEDAKENNATKNSAVKARDHATALLSSRKPLGDVTPRAAEETMVESPVARDKTGYPARGQTIESAATEDGLAKQGKEEPLIEASDVGSAPATASADASRPAAFVAKTIFDYMDDSDADDVDVAFRCPYRGCCQTSQSASSVPKNTGRRRVQSSPTDTDPRPFLALENWREILLLALIVSTVALLTCLCDLVLVDLFPPACAAKRLYEHVYLGRTFVLPVSAARYWV